MCTSSTGWWQQLEVGHRKVITAIHVHVAVDYLFGEKREKEKRRKIKRVMRRHVLTRSTKRMRDQVIVRHQQILSRTLSGSWFATADTPRGRVEEQQQNRQAAALHSR